MSGVDLGGVDGPMPDEGEVDLEEMEFQRRAYDRASPEERRSVIEGRPIEVDELVLDADDRRALAIAANPDEIRDRDRPGK